MYKKNELKNLIYIQDNKPCNEQTIKGLFRSIVEPILDENAESVVFLRLEDKSKKGFSSILKRLEFAKARVYDFSVTPISENFENVLKENIWGKTEFAFVLAERFGAVLIFDYDESDLENTAQIYTLYNSKNLSDSFEIISSNSKVDLKKYEDKWHPDRRDNVLLNNSIRKILDNLNETNQEVIISQIEKEASINEDDAESKLEFLLAKSSHIAHEMRNLFSICNLYSSIIEKQQQKIQLDDDVRKSIFNARDCIKKSLEMAGNLLLDFKSLGTNDLKEQELESLINTAFDMSKVYARDKNIHFGALNIEPVRVFVDENKFIAVLINLIKNAVESIEEEGDIIIDTKLEQDTVKILVSNTGLPIKEEVKNCIFEQGFTTKSSGSGLGLCICKKTLEEQSGQLKLIKSDNVSTDFEITVLRGEG